MTKRKKGSRASLSVAGAEDQGAHVIIMDIQGRLIRDLGVVHGSEQNPSGAQVPGCAIQAISSACKDWTVSRK